MNTTDVLSFDWLQMVTDRDCDQNTCLHLAVENGHYDVVKLSLDKRSDVNTPSSNYMHPLHLAAKAGDIRYCYSGSVWQNYFNVYNFSTEKERNQSTIVSEKIRLNNFHTVMSFKRRITFLSGTVVKSVEHMAQWSLVLILTSNPKVAGSSKAFYQHCFIPSDTIGTAYRG